MSEEKNNTEVNETEISSLEESAQEEREETVQEETAAESKDGSAAEDTASDATEELPSEEAEDNEDEETTEAEEESIPSFTGDVEGETYTFSQLEAASEDYTDEEFHQLAGMYEQTLSEIDEKEIVTGLVVSVDEKICHCRYRLQI